MVLNVKTLFYDCGLWIVNCGFQNADCGERYSFGGQLVVCQLLNSDFGVENNICGF